MIECIECFRAELEALRFGHGKLLVKTDVPVLEAGIVDAATHVRLHVECALRRRGKHRRPIRIRDREPLCRVLSAVGSKLVDNRGIAVDHPELPRAAAAVPVTVLAHAGVVVVRDYLAGSAGLELRDAADLPAAERLADQA